LQDKGVSCPTNCASCSHAYEDLNHLLFECPFAIQVCNSAGIWYDVQNAAMNSDSAVNTIFYLLQNSTMHVQQRFAATCWSLWKHRNLKIWEDVTKAKLLTELGISLMTGRKPIYHGQRCCCSRAFSRCSLPCLCSRPNSSNSSKLYLLFPIGIHLALEGSSAM